MSVWPVFVCVCSLCVCLKPAADNNVLWLLVLLTAGLILFYSLFLLQIIIINITASTAKKTAEFYALFVCGQNTYHFSVLNSLVKRGNVPTRASMFEKCDFNLL